MRACMRIVRPGTCWNRVGRTVRFFAYYFYARAWCEVCGPSASFDAKELRVGERLPLVGAAASPNKYLDFILMFF